MFLLILDPDIVQDVPAVQTQEEEEKNMKRKLNNVLHCIE